jgi:antitoxin (DNA-binding transcriptional repressor) of toxin-antitoxin stability system
MAERLVTLAQLRERLDAVVEAVEQGETVVVIDDQPGQAPVRRIVLVSAAIHGQPAGEQPGAAPAAKEEPRAVEATVGGVAGGLVAGAGTTLSSLTGNPSVERSAPPGSPPGPGPRCWPRRAGCAEEATARKAVVAAIVRLVGAPSPGRAMPNGWRAVTPWVTAILPPGHNGLAGAGLEQETSWNARRRLSASDC